MVSREQSEQLAHMGHCVIEEEGALIYLRASHARIAYILSDQVKKEGRDKKIMAETELVPEKYKWGLEADYIITFYLPNIADLTTDQRRILMFQQLLKIDIVIEKDGCEKYGLKEPDVNDFAVIINKYGTDWANTQPELFSDDEPETAADVMKNEAAKQNENGFDVF